MSDPAATHPEPGDAPPDAAPPGTEPKPSTEALPDELGGPKGPEPTRYGDWEVGGRCTDF